MISELWKFVFQTYHPRALRLDRLLCWKNHRIFTRGLYLIHMGTLQGTYDPGSSLGIIFVNLSSQAILIFSGVSGLLSLSGPGRPLSCRAALIASWMAKNTEHPRNTPDSPRPLDEYRVFEFSEGGKKEMCSSMGMSQMAGILYWFGPRVYRTPWGE